MLHWCCTGILYPPLHRQAQGLVGALHKANGLLPVATQGNLIDVDKLVSHLEIHSCRLAALFDLQHKHSRQMTGGLDTRIKEKPTLGRNVSPSSSGWKVGSAG